MEKRLIFNQFLYLFTTQYIGLFVSIFGGIVLTRLLDPVAFGVLAAFLFYLSSFNWISEFGWDQSFMVHTEFDQKEAAATHCMIRTVTGSLPLIIFGFLGYMGIDFAFKEYYGVLLLLAVSYFFEKISTTPKLLLEREYRLGQCALFELSGTIMSYASAVVAAYYGCGAYSLALQRLLEKSIVSVGYFYSSSWKFSIRGSLHIVLRYLYAFGLATYLGSLVSLIIYDCMGWFVAWYVTVYDAGLYAKAFNLATFPLIFTAICSRLTVPLYTKYQYNVEMIRTIFVKMQLVKMLVLIPLQIGLALTSFWWIPRILGAQWVPLIPLYMMMSIYGLARSFFDDVPNLLTYGFRNPWVLTQSQSLQASTIICIGFLLIPRLGVWGAVLTMTMGMLVALLYLWYHVLRSISCSYKSFYGATKEYWDIIKQVKGFYARQ